MAEWKSSWKSSKKPRKQRKYREEAEYHHRKKFVSAHLSDKVQEKIGTRSLPIREGDEVEVMRGDWKGLSGKVNKVDLEDYKIYVEGIDRERVDTTDTKIALRSSNLKLTKLNLDDAARIQKYNVSEEDKQEIEAKEEEEEKEDDEGEENEEEKEDKDTEEDEGDN